MPEVIKVDISYRDGNNPTPKSITVFLPIEGVAAYKHISGNDFEIFIKKDYSSTFGTVLSAKSNLLAEKFKVL